MKQLSPISGVSLLLIGSIPFQNETKYAKEKEKIENNHLKKEKKKKRQLDQCHTQGTGRASLSKEKPDVTESERGSFDPDTNVYPSIRRESQEGQ